MYEEEKKSSKCNGCAWFIRYVVDSIWSNSVCLRWMACARALVSERAHGAARLNREMLQKIPLLANSFVVITQSQVPVVRRRYRAMLVDGWLRRLFSNRLYIIQFSHRMKIHVKQRRCDDAHSTLNIKIVRMFMLVLFCCCCCLFFISDSLLFNAMYF